jgi:hypothetical protein
MYTAVTEEGVPVPEITDDNVVITSADVLGILAGSLADIGAELRTPSEQGLPEVTVRLPEGQITISKTAAIDKPGGDVDGYAVTIHTASCSGVQAIADSDSVPTITRDLAARFGAEIEGPHEL